MILYVPHNTKEIRHTYESKYNAKRQKQVILLMIIDVAKWHYLSLKSLSALLREITSNNNEDLYCTNCIHSFRTKTELKKHKFMQTLWLLLCMLEVLFIIYVDVESLLEKISTCHNNPEKSSTTKIIKNKNYVYSLFIQCSFDAAKKKDLIHQIMKPTDRCLKEGMKKWLDELMKKVMKNELGGKIMTEFVPLRLKTCSYLIDDG